jgi:hypothetical protein
MSFPEVPFSQEGLGCLGRLIEQFAKIQVDMVVRQLCFIRWAELPNLQGSEQTPLREGQCPGSWYDNGDDGIFLMVHTS